MLIQPVTACHLPHDSLSSTPISRYLAMSQAFFLVNFQVFVREKNMALPKKKGSPKSTGG